MASFYTKIVSFIDEMYQKSKDKPEYIKCEDYSKIGNHGCFGAHKPFLQQKCERCISLDLYKWLYIVIDNDMTTDEINKLRETGLYIHDSLIDVEVGVMPCMLQQRIEEVIDKYAMCRGLAFATRNAEAIEALVWYSSTKGFLPIYIYKGQVIDDYKTLEKLFDSGYGKMLSDIKKYKKNCKLK